MARVQIQCPSCSKMGTIEVSENLLKSISRGLLAINVKKSICEHSFITYIDKNLYVRDYFTADFQIELPELVPDKEFEEKKVLPTDLINLDVIKFNLPGTLLSYVLKSIFLKKKIILLSDQILHYNYFINFFKLITQKAFDINIKITTKEDFERNEDQYREYLIFEDINIIRDKDKVINPKKLKIEEHFVKKFLGEPDLNTSLIVLRNDIHRTYELTKLIVEFIKNHDKKEKIQSIHLINYLKEVYNKKIPQIYLNFLLEIVENYFEVKIPKRLRLTFY